jgi:hypothetical protein
MIAIEVPINQSSNTEPVIISHGISDTFQHNNKKKDKQNKHLHIQI